MRGFLALLFAGIFALAGIGRASALPLSTYAETSVLASGKWVKISVNETGMHLLTNAALKKMGFNDPSKVNVYGYGAERIPENFKNYIDDLPMVQTLHTDRGILFYARGPVTFTSVTSQTYRPVNNPFTSVGYYFLSDREAATRHIEIIGRGEFETTSAETTFSEVAYHELELVNPGQTGHVFLGEDFLNTPRRTFTINTPDIDTERNVSMVCSFMAKSNASTRLSFTINGTQLPQLSSDYVSSNSDEHGHFKEAIITKNFTPAGDRTTIEIGISNSGTITLANLNYISLSYTRKLQLPLSGTLNFKLAKSTGKLAGASASTVVWDVTDPLEILQLNSRENGGSVAWCSPYSGTRQYVAFNPTAKFPEPKFVSTVANQDLHAETVPEMVIFTPAAWADQARRLANHRATTGDSLRVLVVDQELVFNEFSSGSPDVNAFRKYLKMIWDRSQASDSTANLRFALFMGRAIYDNRRIEASSQAFTYPLMPSWQSEYSTTDISSYTTDDIFAFLDDSAASFTSQTYRIGVGRLPVTGATSAKDAVDKIIQYETDMPDGLWRNSVFVIGDDEDNGDHMRQADTLQKNMQASDGGADAFYYTLLPDRYQREGGQYPKAREVMFRKLDEGVAWWMFIGHANTTSLTHENLLVYNDINNLYLRRYPIFIAACCDFLRYDSKSISAAEIMWALKGGGAIAVVSAVRPTFITDNGKFMARIGDYVLSRDKDNRRLTVGESIMAAKNALRGDDNKFRYVLIGDPSMYPIVPDNRVVVTSIANTDVDGDIPPEIQARQKTTIEGYIADHNGCKLDNFSGTISSTIYDAEYSVTTLGQGDKGFAYTYNLPGERLTVSNDSIVGGNFKINVSMPAEIAGNYRPATVNLAAFNSDARAAGVNRNFYVFGEDLTASDTIPPTIDNIYINHPSFRDGDRVNTTPYLIAEVSDESGINISSAGIGHQITVMIDGKKSFSNVSQYFSPSLTEAGAGTINFPLGTLTEGVHTARLRVWDNAANSASREVSFVVAEDQAPTLYDIYPDANPASTATNFYLTHDRPDANIEVTVTIYNLLGKAIWSSTTSGRSDLYRSFPVQWNLTDYNGSRVARGIYLYRASIKEDGLESETKTKKIAVTG